MGNARLLTMNGDGHTAFFNGSECIDSAVIAYVIDYVVPPEGTQCDQAVPFPLPTQPVNAEARAGTPGIERRYAGRLAAPLGVAR